MWVSSILVPESIQDVSGQWKGELTGIVWYVCASMS
jgi:hypothetical protein